MQIIIDEAGQISVDGEKIGDAETVAGGRIRVTDLDGELFGTFSSKYDLKKKLKRFLTNQQGE